MTLKITSITLKEFRVFRDFKAAELGRVNLITGKNKSGKTSLLEALRLLSARAEPAALDAMLTCREDEWRRDREEDKTYALLRVLLSLFHDFPSPAGNPGPLVIATQGEAHPLNLELKFGRPDLDEKVAGVKDEPPGSGIDNDLALQATTWEAADAHTRLYPLGQFDDLLPQRKSSMPPAGERFPCVLVGPDNGQKTTELAGLWDKIAHTPLKEPVVAALQLIEPGIETVSMTAGERSRSRIAVVRSKHIPHPVPLRSFGDGMSRLFGIFLSLVNARGGLLLIDEFENGLHYTTQHKAWPMIFNLAEELDVQVFAASHSWDAIDAFQKAVAAAKEVGALIRLTRVRNNIIPTVFNEKDLEVIARSRIEVR